MSAYVIFDVEIRDLNRYQDFMKQVKPALEAEGGEIIQFGMPVDPGNLLLVGKLGAIDILGVDMRTSGDAFVRFSADIGAETNRAADGRHTEPFRLARGLCLMGAVAAGVQQSADAAQAIHLLAESIDEQVQATLRRKTATLTQLFDKQED
mgnify:CR=1 FL=1